MYECVSPMVNMLEAEPYKDILQSPGYQPTPEVTPNKTIDQLIMEALGGFECKYIH